MATSAKLDRRYWLLSVNAGMASYLDAAILVSTGVALPLWTQSLHLSTWWSGAVSTILTLAVAVGSFFGGRLSDVFGRVSVFNIDILFVVMGALMAGFAPNTGVLVAALIVCGLASGADLPTSLAVISERVPREVQGRIVSSTELFWIAGIILSQGIGLAVSGIGVTGVKVLFGFIAFAAFVTWLIRVASPSFKKIEDDLYEEFSGQQTDSEEGAANSAYPVRKLLSNKRYLIPMVLLTIFYVMWNLPANTWGSFQTYYMVEIGGRSQAFATACGLIANVLTLLATYLIFMRLADTKHRYQVMFTGVICGILAFVVSAIAGGQWMVFTVCYFVFSATNCLHGESIYKIWSQQLYPANARASATGFTYALVRFITAIFGFITPTIMAFSPTLLLWLLVAFLVLSMLTGVATLRFIKRYDIEDPVVNPKTEVKANSAVTA